MNQIVYRPHIVAALVAGRAAAPLTAADVLAREQEITTLHLHTFQELQDFIATVVAHTQAIQNAQQYRYGAVLTEEMVKQVLRHLMSATDEYADHTRSAIKERSRT